MDPQQLSRLQEEQAKAVEDTDAQIVQIEKFMNDYKLLQERLKTLPDSLTHDVMVPFGKLAFMPGKLVHTNEIMVLLGDNWFAERTAKQARDIAGRRISELDTQLDKLKKQRKLLEPRVEFTSDLQTLLQGQDDVKEIVEEYDAEKERQWAEQHRKNVRRQREEERRGRVEAEEPVTDRSVPQKSIAQKDVDANLWARLDALEKREAERGELDSSSNDSTSDTELTHAVQKPCEARTKAVRWLAESGTPPHRKLEGDSDDGDGEEETASDDEEEDDEDESEAEEKPDKRLTGTIRFSHTDIVPAQARKAQPSGDAITIESPADIYKLYVPASILKTEKPATEGGDLWGRHDRKPIKKLLGPAAKETAAQSQSSRKQDAEVGHEPHLPKPISQANSGALKAFSGCIKEVSPALELTKEPQAERDLTKQQSPAIVQQDSHEPQRRVSKFKAARMAQQGSS